MDAEYVEILRTAAPFTLAAAAIGLIMIIVDRRQKKAKKPKPVPPRPRVNTQDEGQYEKIQQLIRFFVAEMHAAGLPGLSAQTSRPFTPSREMLKQSPSAKAMPIEIKVLTKAWWGGSQGLSCITPEGQWEYYGTCLSYREGTTDEFGAWWVVSSRHFKQSAEPNDPYPFNLYRVYDSGMATLPHALKAMGDMMEELLRRHRPSAVQRFQAMRKVNGGRSLRG